MDPNEISFAEKFRALISNDNNNAAKNEPRVQVPVVEQLMKRCHKEIEEVICSKAEPNQFTRKVVDEELISVLHPERKEVERRVSFMNGSDKLNPKTITLCSVCSKKLLASKVKRGKIRVHRRPSDSASSSDKKADESLCTIEEHFQKEPLAPLAPLRAQTPCFDENVRHKQALQAPPLGHPPTFRKRGDSIPTSVPRPVISSQSSPKNENTRLQMLPRETPNKSRTNTTQNNLPGRPVDNLQSIHLEKTSWHEGYNSHDSYGTKSAQNDKNDCSMFLNLLKKPDNLEETQTFTSNSSKLNHNREDIRQGGSLQCDDDEPHSNASIIYSKCSRELSPINDELSKLGFKNRPTGAPRYPSMNKTLKQTLCARELELHQKAQLGNPPLAKTQASSLENKTVQHTLCARELELLQKTQLGNPPLAKTQASSLDRSLTETPQVQQSPRPVQKLSPRERGDGMTNSVSNQESFPSPKLNPTREPFLRINPTPIKPEVNPAQRKLPNRPAVIQRGTHQQSNHPLEPNPKIEEQITNPYTKIMREACSMQERPKSTFRSGDGQDVDEDFLLNYFNAIPLSPNTPVSVLRNVKPGTIIQIIDLDEDSQSST